MKLMKLVIKALKSGVIRNQYSGKELTFQVIRLKKILDKMKPDSTPKKAD
jgi:20S proteasome alpha/beta subunit